MDAIKKKQYEIGQWVSVKAKLEPVRTAKKTNHSVRTLERVYYTEPRMGRIVGATHRSEGDIFHDGRYQSRYEADHTVFVWRVRFGLTNKAVDVMEDDIEVVEHKGQLPTRYVEISEEVRGYYRENAEPYGLRRSD